MSCMNDLGISTLVLQTRIFLPPLTTLTLPSSFVDTTTAVEAYLWNQYPSMTVFAARSARERAPRKKRKNHVPKYAAGDPGVQDEENKGSLIEVWNPYLSLNSNEGRYCSGCIRTH